jgi:hypothetical protein
MKKSSMRSAQRPGWMPFMGLLAISSPSSVGQGVRSYVSWHLACRSIIIISTRHVEAIGV